MPETTIYHNPRCSKSRQTLELLKDRGHEPVAVEYLNDPPDEATLRNILKMLGLQPIELMRTKESLFNELGIGDWDKGAADYDDRLIQAMLANPKLIERPIVVSGGKARIGRPPEQVLEIL